MIIDTHTHFYDPNRSQGVPWPSADDELHIARCCLSTTAIWPRPRG